MKRTFEILNLLAALSLLVSIFIAIKPLFYFYENNVGHLVSFTTGGEIILEKKLYLYPICSAIILNLCLTGTEIYNKKVGEKHS